MKSATLLPLLLSAAAAWVVPPPMLSSSSSIPPCSVTSPHPCSCPAGTSYVWMQTWFSWGASAHSVQKLVGNFSDLSWVPQKIVSTTGPDNEVGSRRITSVPLDVGTFDWEEVITEYSTEDDGSFVWAFEVVNVPLNFTKVPGRWAGEWERFEATSVGEHQTDVWWTLYGCHTGGTHSFPVFQNYCHDHVHDTLTDMGVLKGVTTEPYSDIKIGHRDGALYKPGLENTVREYGTPSYEEARQYVMERTGIRVEKPEL